MTFARNYREQVVKYCVCKFYNVNVFYDDNENYFYCWVGVILMRV